MDTENQNFVDSNPKRYKIGNIIEITKINIRNKIIIQNKNIKISFFHIYNSFNTFSNTI